MELSRAAAIYKSERFIITYRTDSKKVGGGWFWLDDSEMGGWVGGWVGGWLGALKSWQPPKSNPTQNQPNLNQNQPKH